MLSIQLVLGASDMLVGEVENGDDYQNQADYHRYKAVLVLFKGTHLLLLLHHQTTFAKSVVL